MPKHVAVVHKMKIRPFHMFTHRCCRCVINIEEMRAQAVDENTAAMLAKLDAEPGAALPSSMAEQLGKLDLIANGGRRTRKQDKKEPVPIVNMPL